MLTLLQIILIACVAATPALVISIANHDMLAEPEGGTALRTAAIFSICSGLMAMAGYWIGNWMRAMMQDDMLWIVDTIWFVVGLKMIFTSFKVHLRYKNIKLSSAGSTILAGIAVGIDTLLIAMALGIIHEELSLFVVYVTGLVLLFSLSGLKLLSGSETLVKHNQRLLLISGSLLMFLALFVF